MSKRTQGGVPLRLVSGLTILATVVSAVIAANLHREAPPPTCTLSGRTVTDVAGGDVVKLYCTNLNPATYYTVTVATSAIAGWSTSDRAGGTGSGSSPANAMGFDGTSGSDSYINNGSGYTAFTGANRAFRIWILTSNPASDETNKYITLKASGTTITDSSAVPITIYEASSVFNSPITVPATLEANMTVTGLPVGERYKFTPSPGSNTNGWSTIAQGSTTGMTGNAFTFGPGPGLTNTYTADGSDTVYFATTDPGMDGNTHAVLALCDTDGNVILAEPTNFVIISHP